MRGEQLRTHLHRRIATEVARWAADQETTTGRPPSDEDRRMFTADRVEAALRQHAAEALQRGEPPLADTEERELRAQLRRTLSDATAPFAHLLELPGVTDIAINGYRDVRTRTIDGREERHPPFCSSDEELIEIFQQVGRRSDRVERSWTPTSPKLELFLERYKARVACLAWVCEPVVVSIRLHPHVRTRLRGLVALGMMDEGVASLLRACTRARLNGVIAGGTGTGKTTLMRAMLHECEPSERLIVIESEPELHLDADDHHNQVIVCFERDVNAEGKGQFTIEQHARAVKRHNPDRVVLGEARGGEIVPVLEAMSLGVDGSLCTIHSRDTASVFPRMAVFARQAHGGAWTRDALLELAGIAVDFVVLCRRDPASGLRTVSEFRFVDGYDPAMGTIMSQDWFIPGPDGRATPNPSAPIPQDMFDLLTAHGYDPGAHALLGVA